MNKHTLLLLLFLLSPTVAFSAEPNAKVDVKNLQREYWNKSNDTEVEAVQNRLYSKKLKFEIGFFGGSVSTDPFISDWSVGASIGFHISEYFAIAALYWKDLTSNSTTYDTFVASNGLVPNTDIPRHFLGGEIAFNPLYGKLSLLNQGILYFDTHFMVGGGVRNSESGNAPVIYVGAGEQIYLSQHVSIRLDYRMFRFTETRLEKVLKATYGQPVGQDIRIDSNVTLSLSFLIG